jgi:hypothetical protein
MAKYYKSKHKNKQKSIEPKSSESFVWKDVVWRKIEIRLNIIQQKIYAAKVKLKRNSRERRNSLPRILRSRVR